MAPLDESQRRFDAVFFDFGGVLTTSPFDEFSAYEKRVSVPDGLIRSINSTDPDANAWARLERNEISLDEFADAFEAEARGRGFELDGASVLACLNGTLRTSMVEALRAVSPHFITALLTNNVMTDRPRGSSMSADPLDDVLGLFDVIIESSVVGVRKPEPRFYEIACERAGVAADRVVFLDDLGINLKVARQMGMTTIKVVDADSAIDQLSAALGMELGR